MKSALIAVGTVMGSVAALSLSPTPAAAAASANSAPATYRPLPVQRVLDTRAGTGAPKQSVAPGGTVHLQLAGVAGVPGSGAGSVVLNLTATAGTASGYVTAYPTGTTRPTASNLNWAAGATVPNLTIAGLGSDGSVTLYNGSSGSVQLVADIQGYYTDGAASTAGAFRAVGPSRLLDTRTGTGATRHAVAAGGSVDLVVSPAAGVPAAAGAVALNLTATSATAAGHLTAYPTGTVRPTASNLQFGATRPTAGLALVRVGDAGRVTIYNGSSGTVQLIADVQGYATSGTAADAGALTAQAPVRLLDTRNGIGGAPGAVKAGDSVAVKALSQAGVPASGVEAVVLTVTATGATHGGYVTAYPASAVRPLASTLNFLAGQTVANLVVVPLDETGTVRLYNSSAGPLQIVADVAGYVRAPDLTWTPTTEVDPFHTFISAISCPTTTFCAGGDRAGNVQTFDGTSWSPPVKTGTGQQVITVSCASASFCVAGDFGGNVIIWNGSSWAPAVNLGPNYVRALSCVSSTYCLLVDSASTMKQFNGSSWSTAATFGPGQVTSLSCATSTFCAGVTTTGTVATYDGTTWTADTSNVAAVYLASVSCASATFCMAVGNTTGAPAAGVAVAYSGGAWQPRTTVFPGGQLNKVDCPAVSECLAIATPYSTSYRYDGAWSGGSTFGVVRRQVSGFDCATVSRCLALDTSGYQFTYDGTSWSTAAYVQTINRVSSVSCVSSTFCMATDTEGFALRYDGAHWTTPAPVVPGNGLVVSCPTSTFCAAVGGSTAVTWSGGAWGAPVTVDAGHRLFGLSCSDATHCFAADEVGNVVAYTAGTWSAATPAVSGGYIERLSCPTSTFCVGSGHMGGLTTYDGVSWSPLFRPAGSDQFQNINWNVSCSSPSWCVGSDDNAHVLTFDGAAWHVGGSVFAGAWGTLSCVRSSFCAATYTWDVNVFNGAQWQPTASQPAPGLAGWTSLSCPSDDFCMLVSAEGFATAGTV